ncbi:hypothetical protein C8J32_103381 [Rhizobium sp. PP-CC-3A-592]|nr:hypothetical protein C8J32_103381 [Rhizobium sp. PP-CC-3A-592]
MLIYWSGVLFFRRLGFEITNPKMDKREWLSVFGNCDIS